MPSKKLTHSRAYRETIQRVSGGTGHNSDTNKTFSSYHTRIKTEQKLVYSSFLQRHNKLHKTYICTTKVCIHTLVLIYVSYVLMCQKWYKGNSSSAWWKTGWKCLIFYAQAWGRIQGVMFCKRGGKPFSWSGFITKSSPLTFLTRMESLQGRKARNEVNNKASKINPCGQQLY